MSMNCALYLSILFVISFLVPNQGYSDFFIEKSGPYKNQNETIEVQPEPSEATHAEETDCCACEEKKPPAEEKVVCPPGQIPIPKQPDPWFTGPLLTPSGHVIPVGHINIEPYIFATETIGTYDSHWKSHSVTKSWSINPEVPIQIGIIKSVDFLINPQMFYNTTRNQHSTRFGDLVVGFDIQLIQDKPGKWWPAVKITPQVKFPTGKYQHGNPDKLGTDLVGSGSYISGLALVFSHLYHIYCAHFLNTRLAFMCNIPSNVNVEGFNTYGGGFGTKGTAKVGNNYSILFGLEYSLTQQWALAFDGAYFHFNKNTFSGNPGTVTPGGLPAAVGSPSSEQFSIAPAIEYNFNANVGLIVGPWLTIGGRNTSQFVSWVAALNIYK